MAKPKVIGWIETNYDSIECNFYATMGQWAYAAALGSVFTAQFYAAGGFALVGGAAELAFNLADCGGDPPPPIPPDGGADDRFCWESATCGPMMFYTPPEYNPSNIGAPSALKITAVEKTQQNSTQSSFRISYIDCSGNPAVYSPPIFMQSDIEWGISSDNCIEGKPIDPITHEPGQPLGPAQTYSDDDGCNWTIEPTDAYVDDDGQWHTYYTITADNDACGGPFAYWSSKDGPQFVQPDPRGPDPVPPPGHKKCPDPCTDYSDELEEIKKLLEEVKSCACKEKPQLAGSWVTTRWKSDEVMDHSGTRLRKLFRYRSKSSRNLKQLSDYWRNFTWDAGDVCVRHKGAWWGDPQVWAKSQEEGKRVIRFAAAEAGLDPDTTGEWAVSSSRSPRIGMSGKMRIHLHEGFPWVANRDGSDWPNYLA